MTGGVNNGGAHRTWLREQLLFYGVPPVPVYKGGGEEAAGLEGARHGGKPNRTPSPIRPLPFLRRGEGEGEGREGKGGAPPPLVQFGLPMGGGRGHPLWAASPLSYGPCRPITFPGGFQ